MTSLCFQKNYKNCLAAEGFAPTQWRNQGGYGGFSPL